MGAKEAGGCEYLYYFINIYASVLDNNFCFFEYANKQINVRANTSDFIHGIYNDCKSNLEVAIWS